MDSTGWTSGSEPGIRGALYVKLMTIRWILLRILFLQTESHHCKKKYLEIEISLLFEGAINFVEFTTRGHLSLVIKR